MKINWLLLIYFDAWRQAKNIRSRKQSTRKI